MLKGIVKFWNEDKGFGFIEIGKFPHDYDLFFHISSCNDYKPRKGDVIMCIKDRNERGNFAKEIVPTGERVNVKEYFDNRVSRKRYEEARKNALKFERGCTCEEDKSRREYGSDEYYDYCRKCWYCNEMSD